MSPVTGAAKSYASVSSASEYQPANTCPTLTGASGSVAVLPHTMACGSTALLPSVSKVTVWLALGATGPLARTTRTLAAWARVAPPSGSSV